MKLPEILAGIDAGIEEVDAEIARVTAPLSDERDRLLAARAALTGNLAAAGAGGGESSSQAPPPSPASLPSPPPAQTPAHARRTTIFSRRRSRASATAASMVAALLEQEGPMRQQDIAERLGIHRGSMSTVMNRLQGRVRIIGKENRSPVYEALPGTRTFTERAKAAKNLPFTVEGALDGVRDAIADGPASIAGIHRALGRARNVNTENIVRRCLEQLGALQTKDGWVLPTDPSELARQDAPRDPGDQPGPRPMRPLGDVIADVSGERVDPPPVSPRVAREAQKPQIVDGKVVNRDGNRLYLTEGDLVVYDEIAKASDGVDLPALAHNTGIATRELGPRLNHLYRELRVLDRHSDGTYTCV